MLLRNNELFIPLMVFEVVEKFRIEKNRFEKSIIRKT
jgi:hypothetical protein